MERTDEYVRLLIILSPHDFVSNVRMDKIMEDKMMGF